MKLKKALSLILVFVLSFTLTSCKEEEEQTEYAIKVGDAQIERGVYAYYLDSKMKVDGEWASKDDALEAANQLCLTYTEINTEFEKRGLSLTSSAKTGIASSVDGIWEIYGDYYTQIGVTKQDITKIKTSEAYKEQLVSSEFGAEGASEIPEATLRTYYNENYIFFKVISAQFTGEEEEDEELKATFKELKSDINEEYPIDLVNKDYIESLDGTTGDTMDVSMMKKGSDTYPEQFFTDVLAMKVDEVSMFTYDNGIYIVEREDGTDNFSDYEDEILKTMSKTDFDTLLASAYSDVKISPIKDVQNECFKTIKSVKSK